MTRAYRRTIETPRIATTFPAGQFEGVVLAFSETPALVVEKPGTRCVRFYVALL
jgi:hypothetical protein